MKKITALCLAITLIGSISNASAWGHGGGHGYGGHYGGGYGGHHGAFVADMVTVH